MYVFFCLGYRDVVVPIPPCPSDLGEASDGDSSDRSGVTRSQSERLLAVCREFSSSYRELQEKYHDAIYSTADKAMRSSQSNQLKQLKTMLEKETSDVMRQLNLARRNEVKNLALVHKDRDELVRYKAWIYYNFVIMMWFLLLLYIFFRMKREVASALVERGVTERVRLAQAYEKKRDELQKQHDYVRNALSEHKAKVSTYI